MVLQRDRPDTFWGWTTPGAGVTVTIEEPNGRAHKGDGVADAQGKWLVRVSPPKVGGPYKVDIDGPQHAELNDVLVGDVWICSGQSNMEFGIGNCMNSQQEIADANYPNIRLAMLPHDIEFAPKDVGSLTWEPCSPETVKQNAPGGWNGFSAVAYFFGRELNKRLNVPIGLLQTCWGGTIAEAWTSKRSLLPLKDFDARIAAVEQAATRGKTDYASQIDAWYAANDPGSSAGSQSTSLDDSSWASTPGVSSNYDAINLSQFDGVVWYRKEVDLQNVPAGPVVLSIGSVDDQDTTWVNGVQVGRMFHYNDVRKYNVPAGVFQPGKNEIVVRCLDTGGQGGFIGTPDQMYLQFADGSKQAMEGPWKYQVGADLAKSKPVPRLMDDGDPNVPTVLYNGMIHPLQPLAIKGAIWYQGESNADRAEQYRRLLPTMIEDWRREWHAGEFPFFIVQLANFMAPDAQPADSQWAELREAQTETAKRVRNAGLALAIDIGDAQDIHPKDKQDVGLRLALAALHVAYHQNVPYSGPTYRSQRIEGDTIRLSFENEFGGLKLKGDTLKGFAIAGADHKFHWATARIDGDSVVVESADVAAPIAVRYDWGNNPDGNLYNSADLPAVPFKTDNWPWVTAGRK